MTPEQEMERGRQAALLLDNVIYKEATEAVRNAIMESWATSPIRDKEGAHELRLMLHCLKTVEQHIKTVADTGRMAQIKREQSLGKRIMNLVA